MIVKVYEPAVNPLGEGDTEYGAVPPLPVTVTTPSAPPLQETFEATEHDAERTAGSVIVTVQEAVQPFASEIL